MSQRLVRSGAYGVWTLAMAAMVYLTYLHGTYADRMPQAPQAQTGRAHAVFVMRSTRYVSERDASDFEGERQFDWDGPLGARADAAPSEPLVGAGTRHADRDPPARTVSPSCAVYASPPETLVSEVVVDRAHVERGTS